MEILIYLYGAGAVLFLFLSGIQMVRFDHWKGTYTFTNRSESTVRKAA